ncbi:hypothetical protein XA68_17788 [Ophiocordyceps unilateralis]|uniref:Uncharacterized protein n=1 Tax=Ophiocordyceps unilateralis TaxID=268505 RepID=A0A2A9PIE6_OPHUN|nr:hypothetical protein XA68_17788 [Ophiocordyceps unilateralis]
MLGKILLTIDAIGLAVGPVIADMNETHMYNPRWPPHAKFHNAQTITLAALLGLLILYFTWRNSSNPSLRRESTKSAMIFGSIYWIAGCCAQLFPGADGLDPEFGGPGFPQLKIFLFFLSCGILGGVCDLNGL